MINRLSLDLEKMTKIKFNKNNDMDIKRNHYYRIKYRSEYFANKYGDTNPMVLVEDIDSVILNGFRWFDCVETNMACKTFLARQLFENYLPIDESLDDSKSREVYYVKIKAKDSPFSLGEFVYKDELDVI